MNPNLLKLRPGFGHSVTPVVTNGDAVSQTSLRLHRENKGAQDK